jgi:hypothetical protein
MNWLPPLSSQVALPMRPVVTVVEAEVVAELV